MAGTDLYHKLYGMLYRKHSGRDLRCYEDAAFTPIHLAIDKADGKAFQYRQNLFGICLAGVAAITFFIKMYTSIKPLCCLSSFHDRDFSFGTFINKLAVSAGSGNVLTGAG